MGKISKSINHSYKNSSNNSVPFKKSLVISTNIADTVEEKHNNINNFLLLYGKKLKYNYISCNVQIPINMFSLFNNLKEKINIGYLVNNIYTKTKLLDSFNSLLLKTNISKCKKIVVSIRSDIYKDFNILSKTSGFSIPILTNKLFNLAIDLFNKGML